MLAYLLQLLVAAAAFAFGLLALAAVLPGMHVRGVGSAFKAAVLTAVLSVVVGEVLLWVLKLVFFLPILLLGPLGPFLIRWVVNAVMLGLTAWFVDGIEFRKARTRWTAAFALTVAQALVRSFL
jgi:uncharacterized membrane protein YvlD (DUF360 family)